MFDVITMRNEQRKEPRLDLEPREKRGMDDEDADTHGDENGGHGNFIQVHTINKNKRLETCEKNKYI